MQNLLAGAIPVLLAAQLAQASLTGIVRDSETGEPVAGAIVVLTELNLGASTDSLGRYEIDDVPPGPHHLAVRKMGYAPRSLHALVPRDGTLEINVSIHSQPVRLESIDVQAPVRLRGTEAGTTTHYPDREMSIDAVRNHPLLAEPEVFQALDGGEVVVSQETPGGVSIRGGASDQTAYLLDGVPIFNPYHAAGMSSAWNPDALSRLYLSSVELPSEAPHALSGTVEADTRRPGGRVYSQGSISTTQVRATLEGPIGRAGAGYVLSGRSGLHDVIAPNDPDYLDGQTGDWLAKVEARVAGGQFRLLHYGNTNEIGASSVPADSGGSARRHSFEWHSRSLGAEWGRRFGGFDVRLLGWTAASDVIADWAAVAGLAVMDAVRHDAGLLATMEDRRERQDTVVGARADGSTTSYRTEFDPDSAASQLFDLNASTPVWTLLGRHTRWIGSSVEAGAGLSIAMTGDKLYPGPQAMLRWHASERLAFSGSYTLTHQFAQSLRNSESVVGHIFPADVTIGAGAPGIPVAESGQGVLGLAYRPAAGVRIGLSAYDRASTGLVLVAPRTGGPFTTGGLVTGRSTARGISVDAAASSSRYGVIASYGWQRVRNEYGDSSYIPQSTPEHLLEGGLILFPTATTSVRVGASAALGRHATTIPNGLQWESCNLLDRGCEFVGSPDYGAEPVGTTELPPYVRLDVGFRQHWHVNLAGRDGMMALFGTLTNVLDRHNFLTYVRNPATGELSGVDLRPSGPLVVGLDWRF